MIFRLLSTTEVYTHILFLAKSPTKWYCFLMFKPRHNPTRHQAKKPDAPSKLAQKLPVKGPSPIPKKDPNSFPMRINKYLAWKGHATRRDADQMIARKSVTINGRYAVLGDKVIATDVVEVRKNKKAEEYVYYACFKPKGTTTQGNRTGVKGFAQTLPLKGVFPVGSLDENTAGLLIFTNDRRIIDRLESPLHAHPKQYFVEAREPFRANFQGKLNSGVSIEGGPIIPCQVEMKSANTCHITITDTKNRIRQILSMFGADVANLTRTAILNIRLGNLAPNSYRKIEGQELEVFLKKLGL